MKSSVSVASVYLVSRLPIFFPLIFFFAFSRLGLSDEEPYSKSSDLIRLTSDKSKVHALHFKSLILHPPTRAINTTRKEMSIE